MIKEWVFALLMAITLMGAFLAVALKHIFYNILALVVALFGLACLFIYLYSEFLAVMQIIIYIGAIAVAIIFAIMLSVPPSQAVPKRNPKKILKSALLSLLFFIGLVRILSQTNWPQSPVKINDFSTRHIGELIMAQYPLVFEVVSLVLLVSILGAILIARHE